jgi:8-oxo-dGTP diphosphatase
MPLSHPTPRPSGVGTRIIRLAAPALKACYTHGAAVVVRNESDQVLMVRQSWRERGRWGLPGGFLSLGEDPIDGAMRELREETGVTCARERLTQLLAYKQPWARHFDHIFGLTVTGDGTIETRSREIKEQGWFHLDAIEDTPKLTAAANDAFVRLSAAGLLGKQ